MSSVSTFGTFTTARLGIYAAQKGLQITGNNISNINTRGYTRQVLDQISLRTGGSDRYASQYDVKVGNGALPVGVSQIRDPYLDIRYRGEMSSVGALDTKLNILDSIASILDEVARGDDEMGVIEAQFSDLYKALQHLDDSTGQEEFDTQVQSSAKALVTLFNTYASRLEKEKQNTVKRFEQEIETVNKLLTNIKELNSSIRKSDIHGDNTLEQRDERNRLLDELSQYMKIDVVYSMEDIGAGQMVEKLTVKLAGANPQPDTLDPRTDRAVLVDGVHATQLVLGDAADNYSITLAGLTDVKSRPMDNHSTTRTEISEAAFNAAMKALQDLAADPDKPNNVTVDAANGTKTVDDLMGYTYTTKYIKQAGNPTKFYKIETTHAEAVADGIKLDDNDIRGGLQAYREMLTESGEFTTSDTIANVDESAATKRGFPYYQKALDLLANQFAKVMNEANQGYLMNENGEYLNAKLEVLKDASGNPITESNVVKTKSQLGEWKRLLAQKGVKDGNDYKLDGDNYVDENGKPITDSAGNVLTKSGIDDANKQLEEWETALKDNGVAMGKPLFSNNGDGNDTEGITAANISISKDWSTGAAKIIASFVQASGFDHIATTDSSNITHMLALMDKKMDYFPTDMVGDAANEGSMFHGSFQEMLTNLQSVMANDQRSTSIQLNNYYTSSLDLDTQRDSVSSVDLNDEAMNLMQYQKSYAAACRLMTTVDEVLDKLINSTGIVGR